MRKRNLLLMMLVMALLIVLTAGCYHGWKTVKEGDTPQPEEKPLETPAEKPAPSQAGGPAAKSLEMLIDEMHEQESRAQKIAVEFHQILGEIENVVICHTYNDFLSEFEYYTGELSVIWREWSDTVEQGDITHLESLFNSYRSLVDEFEEVMKEAEALKP